MHRRHQPRSVAILAALFLVHALAYADDITLTDGTVFKDAKVVGHDGKKVTISFRAGVAMVEADKVPPALVDAYDVTRDIDSVLPSGSSATSDAQPGSSTAGSEKGGDAAIDPKVKSQVDAGSFQGSGDVIRVVPGKGLIVDLSISYLHQVAVPHTEKKAVDLVPSGLGHTPVMETTIKTWTTTENKTETVEVGTAFVESKPDATSRSHSWTGQVWPVGQYSYVDDDNNSRPIPEFTTRALTAYRYYTTYPDRLAALPKDKILAPLPETTSPVTITTSTSMGAMNGK